MTARLQPSISTLPSLRMLGGTAFGVALGGLHTAAAQSADTAPTELPAVSVEGDQGSTSGYQTKLPSLDKLTSPLVDTPQSIVVVPRQLMNDQHVTTIRDALRNVPGVSLAAGEGAQQGDNLSIRGFNAQNDFYLDGLLDFGSYTRDPFNLESVEVLEGPSSVLFGRGSTGGVINQVSKQPGLKPITAGTITLGTDGTYRFTSDVDRQITGLEGSAVRLNVMGNLNGTAGRDIAEQRRFGFAPEAVFGLGTPTRLTLDYYHLQSYDTPDFGIPWLNGRPAPVGHSSYYGYPDTDFFRTNVDIGTVKLAHDINDAITVSNTLRAGSYYRAQRTTEPLILGFQPPGVTGNNIVAPGIPLSAVRISRNDLALSSHETDIDDQLNGNFQFDTGPVRHTLVGGFELARLTSDPTRYVYGRTTTSLINPSPPVGGPPSFSVSTIAAAVVNDAGVYAVDTANIGQYFDVIFGWRWDRYESTFRQSGTTNVNVGRNDDMPSYRAALVYKPTSYGSIYVDYGTSFDPSAEALSLSAATTSVAPESSTTYELGTKWDLLHERLSLTGSLYQIEKANVRETDPNDATQVILAGDYRVRGFQIGATGHLTDRWELFAGYSFNDAIVVSSPNPLEVGNVPPNAPKNTLSVFTTYKLPWHNIEIGGGVNYVSQRTASSTPVAGTNIIETAPGYWTMSLMAKYPIRPGLSAQVNITNVTNTYFYELAASQPHHPRAVARGALHSEREALADASPYSRCPVGNAASQLPASAGWRGVGRWPGHGRVPIRPCEGQCAGARRPSGGARARRHDSGDAGAHAAFCVRHVGAARVSTAVQSLPGRPVLRHAYRQRHKASRKGTARRIRTDLSATLFLTPPEEYEGGELIVEDHYGTHAVKLPAGSMVVYPASSLHHVTPVTAGARVSAFFWIQSMVRDDGQRTLLFDLDTAIQQLGRDVPDHAAVVQLTGVYHNLIRHWADA